MVAVTATEEEGDLKQLLNSTISLESNLLWVGFLRSEHPNFDENLAP